LIVVVGGKMGILRLTEMDTFFSAGKFSF
jgi:hypothetical protein